MSGQEVKSIDMAVTEASQDARQIQSAGSSNEAYLTFRRELDDIDKNVKDENIKLAYQDNLVKNLGQEMNGLLLEYLNDKDGGAGLRQQGKISKLDIVEKQALGAKPRALTATDKIFLPQLKLSFDTMRNADLKDGGKGKNSDAISDSDLRILQSKASADKYMTNSTQLNRRENFADALLDPTRSKMFDHVESRSAVFNKKDGKISKDDIKEFLEEADKYKGADRNYKYPGDMLQKLQFIRDNWDSPQVRLMREKNGDGKLTRDSIARGCGYSNGYAEYVESYRQSKQSNSDALKETVPPEKVERPKPITVKYNDCERTFLLDKDNRLIGYTKTRNETKEEFLVNEKGEIHSRTGMVGTNATFNVKTNTFSFRNTDGQLVTPTKAEVASVVTAPFNQSALARLSKQQSGHGYWQIGAALINASSVDGETPAETSRQNVILMRALQKQHQSQPGKLGGHEFIPDEKQFEKLLKNIDAYANERQNPAFRESARLLKLRLERLKQTV